MLKGIQWFMERLVERVVPTVASSLLSTLQTMDVLGRAEQQDQIEEAARRYEAEGKTLLATQLREQAQEMTSDAPGESAVKLFESFSRDQPRLLPPEQPESQPTESLDVGRVSRRSGRRTRRRQTLPDPETDADSRNGTTRSQ